MPKPKKLEKPTAVGGSDFAAAAAFAGGLGLTGKRAKILKLVIDSGTGLTNSEIVEKTGYFTHAVSGRLNELVKAGLLRDSGRRKFSSANRIAIIWELDPCCRYGTNGRVNADKGMRFLLFTDLSGQHRSYGPFVDTVSRLAAVPQILELEQADISQLKTMNVRSNRNVVFRDLVEDGAGGYISVDPRADSVELA